MLYLDILWIINFIVDFLLLLTTNRLSGYPSPIGRTVLSAIIGGFYGCICVLPGWLFLARTSWRLVVLGMMGWIAFGVSRDAFRRCILFIFLSMALGGIALGVGRGGFWCILFSALSVCFMCIFGLRGRYGKHYLPVEIKLNGKSHHFTALIDTGNTLSDPITGQQVMVVSSSLGQRLLEQTSMTFSDPIAAIKRIPGGRLIPFHTVGSDAGLLAAKLYHNVTIGKWHGSCLIAFSPQELGRGEAYEALTGGI